MKVGIINVTGYAGAELARILYSHPDAEITCVTGRSAAGKGLGKVFPHLSALDLTIAGDITESVDVVFSALPEVASAEALRPIIGSGVKVVDISEDFRLRDQAEYRRWFGVDHPCPEYLEDFVYGLPELNRKQVAVADLVANPGCYPTPSLLALAPAVKAGIIEPDIVIDAKSGVSGAGRGKHYYSDVNESVMAYSVEGHRHLPEITQELAAVNGAMDLRVTFVPHLVPMTRGILASCYSPLREGAIPSGRDAQQHVRALYAEFYRDEPFVRLSEVPPGTKETLGNNVCAIYPTVDRRTQRLVVISCIDNLVKGAAGQAVQNMNLMFGLPEAMGLEQLALSP